jgi:hypothetical protein
MRYITWVSLAVLVLGMPIAALAQRGGGGGHAGTPAAHAFSTGRGLPLGGPVVGTAPLGLHAPASSYTGIRSGALAYGSRSYGYGSYGRRGRDFRHVPYGFFFAPYYYPDLGYADSAYPDYGPGFDAAADPDAQGALMAQNMLGEQLNRLSAEVEQMRYGQPQPPVLQTRDDPQPPAPPVTLVLRNGQQLKVQNYAVMDQTFWDFSSQPTRKIPITNIDIAASAKATAAGGGEFPALDTNGHDGQ